MGMREKYLGRRAQLQEEIQGLDAKLRSHRETVHLRCDPLADVASWDATGLTSLAAQLEALCLDRRAKADELAAINRELGCQR